MTPALLQFAGLTAVLGGAVGATRARDVLDHALVRLAVVAGVGALLIGISAA